jgi:hypothetical protein
MINVGKNMRLTDELERRLMAQAIEDQFRFRPEVALKNLIARVAGLFRRSTEATTTRTTRTV